MNSHIKTKPAPPSSRTCKYETNVDALCNIVHELDECPSYVLDKYKKVLCEAAETKESDLLPLDDFEEELIGVVRELKEERRHSVLAIAKVLLGSYNNK